MKNHTLLAQDEENLTRVYRCQSGHIHVIYRRTNIAMSTGEFRELLDCVGQTFEYIEQQSPVSMASKHIDVTFDDTVVKMLPHNFRMFVHVLRRAMTSFSGCPVCTTSPPKGNTVTGTGAGTGTVSSFPLRPAGTTI